MPEIIASPAESRHDIERGMLLMAAGVMVVPGIDAIAKVLSSSLAPGQIAWGRFLFQLLLLAPFAAAAGARGFARPSAAHAVRGILMGIATLFFFWALKYLPLADAVAIFFVEPLMLTLISALFLGERIGWRRMLAIGAGFVGALIVIRPSFQSVGPAALLPMIAALAFAVYLAITRHLAPKEDPISMQFWAAAWGTLILSAALVAGSSAGFPILSSRWPDAAQWLLLVAIGVISTAGHLLIVHAFRRAPAGILAPFQYLEIVGAIILGFLVFDDLPDLRTGLGTTIIVASGLYVFQRERRLAAEEGASATAKSVAPSGSKDTG